MKSLNPFYLVFGIVVCLALATANYRGWSLLASVLPRSWHSGAPGSYHK